MPEQPNIVYFHVDNLGMGELGCYGGGILRGADTVRMDAFAAESLKLSHFVVEPQCTPTRSALMTGRYPIRSGNHTIALGGNPGGIVTWERTMGDILSDAGYATACYGKWHLGHHPQFLPTRHGFDSYLGLPYSNDMWPLHPDLVKLPEDAAARKRGYPDLPLLEGERVALRKVTHEDQNQLTTWYTERAVRFIERHRDEPFLLYLAHSMPHVPLHVSEKFRGKTARGLYGDVIEEIDWSVGRVLDTLKALGLEQNTWVIYTSDNGPWLSYGNHAGSAGPLREGKGTNWEGGTRVPCVMRWPGKIPAGADTNDMLMTIDLLPTIANRVGAPLPPHRIDGLDVWPILSRQKGATNPHDGYWFYYETNQLQAVVSGDGRWKLQLPHTYRTMAGQPPGADGTPGPYRDRRIEAAELYDLAGDVGEATDVSAARPDVVKRLEAIAEAARAELGDALTQREGTGARPPGRFEWPKPAEK